MINVNILEVGKGWHQLVISLDAALTKIDPDYKIAQIKEKFGGLRYYISFSENLKDSRRESAHNLIIAVEKLSLVTCEECGQPGNITGDVWIKTLCDECK